MCKSYSMPKSLFTSPGWNIILSRLSVFLIILFIYAANSYAANVVELKIKGAIGPATADYIIRNIDNAQNADLILITLDTPGGLDESTREIIQKFLSSNVPIVTYVSPNGARAASAGTYLLYASTLAAMAPGTQLGAASPVNIAMTGFADETQTNKQTTMQKKITNDAVATLRALAQLRGRNPDFAQKAVLNAETLTSTEALKQGVINYVARDESDLLSQLNGISVMQNNQKITLNTSNAHIELIEPDWRTRFLSIITNPTVAYLLLLLGIYGIFFELVNPGNILPGVIGAISMCIALYALQLLPISYAGFFLILLGIGFIIAEAFVPAYGSLGIGGTIAFIIGSIMLIDSDNQTYQIAWSAIGAMALVNILFFVIILGMAVKARRQSVKHGLIVLIGAKGRTLGDINLEGQAFIRGEIWSVHSKKFIAASKPIKVIGASGLLLEIEEDLGNQGG
ncbi:NfeD family protein [Legionella resiliens]|uniref:Nodulation protein NfeD n=1 Tax=Legionella resiliens TaxID=2905958 RepID=A0ABS8WXQ8_9GAMM|nr:MULTISPECIES: nodulation protein NfeD [unclassified Legionella]MCE0722117.1 nodulation protein NfeD [Legionella sp. 9fVS26]MCE3531271.1 nodulation protein NfeD [Legionella sp. 8cVS16]